jgi:hypothetical protein
MAYELRPGQFSLFKNKFKESDKHPDYKGDGMDLAGNKVSVAAWLKKDKNGNTFMSGKIEHAREQQGAGTAGGDNETAPAARRPPDINPPGGNAPQPRRSMKDLAEDDIPW